MSHQIHYIATCKAHKVSECPFEAAPKAEKLVILDLELSELLNDSVEGNFPAVEFDEPNAFNDFTRCLDSFVLKHVNFLDERSIPLGNQVS